MSFLAPFYLAGLFAVSLPVVFHLIRRAPRGRLLFSSLMFLSPSPPRLTRRSRLENLFLLLVRILVLVLLALAFARPFWRRSALLGFDRLAGRRVAILLDTSASMRRAGLWEQALGEVDRVLRDLGPGDDAALFSFDAEVVAEVKFNDSVPLDLHRQVASLRVRLASLAPTWARTDLGPALIAAAEELHELDDSGAGAEILRQIVLVSDFQEGSRIAALQAYAWPDDVHLELRRVAPAEATNAALVLAGASERFEQDRDPHVRVRVANDRQSDVDRFQLRWEGRPHDAPADEAIGIYVPPGESRVVRVPRPGGDSLTGRVVLSGDAHPFDNTLYLPPTTQEEVPLLYVGSDAADDARGLRYYLERALPETPQRKVRLVARRPGDPFTAEELLEARLVVVGQAVPDPQAARLRKYVEDGGTVLYVLADAAAGASLSRIMGLEELATEEAPIDDYAMWGEILFTHPLLAVFADPRYSDFTKIHFWKHRRVEVDGVPHVQVLARFDDGDPALFEWTCEKGRLLVLTSGWHPDDSQLARSSKFVPLVCRVLEHSGGTDAARTQYEVGDRVLLGAEGIAPASVTVCKPDGTEIKLAGDAGTFQQTDLPGVYHLRWGDRQRHFAVNLAAEEGRTAPLEIGELEDLGVCLGRQPTRAELVKKHRQMQNIELENRQKLWRWLIVAALGVLVVETWLAGYLSRWAVNQPEVAG